MNSSRRRYLMAAASAAALSAGAGCAELLDSDADDSADPDDGNGEDESDEPDETDASGTDVAADDWPSFQRSPYNDGYSPSSAPTDDSTERWSTTLSGALEEQVAVVDGTVYAATDDGTVHALEADSGDELWAESLEGGRSQSPCVVDGLVVVGTEAGELVALDASDGTREWTTELAGPVAGPTAADGTVYVGTSEEPTAYAIDAVEGDELWSADLALNAVDYPAVTADRVYVGVEEVLDGRLHAFDRTRGTEQWIHEGARMQSPTVIGNDIVAPSLTVEFLTPDGFPHRGTGFAGHVIWSPAATDDAVFMGSTGGRFAAKDRDEPGSIWNVDVGRRPRAPAVTDDAVYLTTLDSVLAALDVETGDELWDRSLEGGRPTAPTVADGAVLVGTEEGRLVAFD